MPKRQPKNAFYFFMVNFKEEEKKKGKNFVNLAAVAEAAGPLWRDAPPPVRKKFETMAKLEKQKNNVPEQKFTTTGIPLSVIEQQEREQQEAEETERKDIKNFVNLKAFSNALKDQDIYLMDVNFYCKIPEETYLIGECTVLRFNIVNGIRDTYHEIINPGIVPLGYTYAAKVGSETYALDMPDEHDNRSNYIQILANIMDYLKEENRKAKHLPPIFTMPEKIAPVQNFISQMCRRAGEDEEIFRVYRLDLLFYTLMNALKTRSDEGFPKESLAMMQLKKDLFKYSPGIGCEHHEESDKSVECSMSRVKRWAYSVLDSACEPAAVVPAPGTHVPHDFDLDKIHTYQKQKQGRLALSVAGITKAMSSCNSTVGEYDYSPNDSIASSTKKSRVHVALRIPKINAVIRRAPDLSEEDFPSLAARGKGRGSGSVNRLS